MVGTADAPKVPAACENGYLFQDFGHYAGGYSHAGHTNTESECADKCTVDAACVAFSRWDRACYTYVAGHPTAMQYKPGSVSYEEAKTQKFRQMNKCTGGAYLQRLLSLSEIQKFSVDGCR